jgi:glutamate racemase
LSSQTPIGIFDSGYGGMTILNDIIGIMPRYDFIYLGDNARTPYGTRSFEVVYQFTLTAVKKLFDMGCHLVILACNTASAKALRTIQQNDLPEIDPDRRVLGVIRPSVEAIKEYTITNHIGILGTEGTVLSESYPLEIVKLFPDIVTIQESCPMWVPIVENNEINTRGADYFVKKNITNLLNNDKKIDTIILGCTHYPLLLDTIKKYLPKHIKVISQGEIVAKSLFDYLHRHPEIDDKCSKNAIVDYYTTENPQVFKKRIKIFLDQDIQVNHLDL